ncbi:MAG: RNA 2',3'-cyclic phosphodiesterase [Dermatophilaceae bacterium]
MRVFVAIEPSPDAVEHLDAFLEPRRGTGEMRWSSPSQWHITLAFAGAVPARLAEPLVEAVADAVARHPVAPLALAGGGCFPDVTRASLLWAGVRDGSHLEPVARATRSALGSVGAAPEGGAFVPHVTLARLGGPPRDATRWVRVLETYAGPEFAASEIAVVESHLPTQRGHRPRHEVLARLPVGG